MARRRRTPRSPSRWASARWRERSRPPRAAASARAPGCCSEPSPRSSPPWAEGSPTRAPPAGRSPCASAAAASSPTRSGAEQLDAVAPRVCRVEAADAWERVVPLHVRAGGPEPLGEAAHVVDAERRVRLPRGREVRLDADVQLLEPDAAAAAQRLGLLDLREPEQVAVERPRRVLAAGRPGHLHMV